MSPESHRVGEAFLVGVILGLIFVVVARRIDPRDPSRIYALGLVLAALVYLGFAVARSADARWLGIESLGVLLYGSAAWVGFTHSRAVLALGWAAHVLWDVLLHLDGTGSSYTPSFYPWLCIGFDVVLAGAVWRTYRLDRRRQ